MATIANLNILLTLDDQVSKGIDKSRTALLAWGESIRNTGSLLTDNVTRPVLDFISGSVNAASDLAEATSAVEEVYGSAADVVIQRSNEAAAAVGLSRDEYLSTATVLGVYGDTLGTSALETAEFSDSLITAAADLGSFYNANTPEVLGAMQAALRGEFDPLERFGIMMNMAALEQHALEEGIWDGNGALTNQQRILAAHSFIMDRMGSAAGDFARTSNGLANSQKILRAQLRNVAVQMGQVLLPTMTKLVTMLRELTTRFQGIPENWQRWIVYIALAAAAVGPLLVLLGTLMTLLPAIGAALAVLTGPIGLVVAAIALLTAAYLGNWWGFRDAVNGVADAIERLYEWFKKIDAVRTAVSSGIGSMVSAFDRMFDAIGKVGSALLEGDWRTALAGIGDFLAVPAKHVGEFIKGIETGFEPIDRLLNDVGNMFTDFGRIVQELFQGDFSGAFNVFKRAIERLPEIVSQAFGLIPWSEIGATIVTAIQGLPELITDAGTLLYEKGSELLTGLINGVGSAIPGLTALLGVLWSVAQTAVGELGETLYEHGAALIGGLIGGAQDMYEGLKSSIGRVPGIAVEAVGELGGTLYNAGADLIGGFIGGIQSLIPSVKDVISNLIDWIPDAVKGLLGINSPSRVFMEIGGYLGEGLALGITQSIPGVERAIGSMAGAAMFDANNPAYSSAFSAATGLHVDRNDEHMGSMGGGFTNYGIYQEADRYWAPEQSMRSRDLSRNRR